MIDLKEMFSTGTGIDDAVFMQMLKEVDTNGDGIIDFEEFVEIMLAQEAVEQKPEMILD